MADDSLEIREPLDFHPCNTPRGTLYYDLNNILTDEQQTKLNTFKRNTIRGNECYLAKHPEVRALIALVTRHVLLHRPRSDLEEFVGYFFSRAKLDIREEMQQYIANREPHKYEGDSAVIIREESSVEGESVSSICEEEEEEDITAIPREMLDEIIDRAYERLGVEHIDVTSDWVLPEEVEQEETSASVVKNIISEILNRSAVEAEAGHHDKAVIKYLSNFKTEQEEMDNSSDVAQSTDVDTELHHVSQVTTELHQEDGAISTEEVKGGEQTQEVAHETPKHEEEEVKKNKEGGNAQDDTTGKK